MTFTIVFLVTLFALSISVAGAFGPLFVLGAIRFLLSLLADGWEGAKRLLRGTGTSGTGMGGTGMGGTGNKPAGKDGPESGDG